MTSLYWFMFGLFTGWVPAMLVIALLLMRATEGPKCWQCAKPIADCKCPNIKHERRT